jgi:hypothetical protein
MRENLGNGRRKQGFFLRLPEISSLPVPQALLLFLLISSITVSVRPQPTAQPFLGKETI